MRKLPSVAVRLSESEREALERAAVADDRAISAMARRIIAEWLRDKGYTRPGNREDAQNETHSGRFPMSDKPETATVLRPTHDDIALAEKVLDEAECRELPDRIADLIASTRAAERERCARRVERFFAPRSGALERRYGVTLADHIREGT